MDWLAAVVAGDLPSLDRKIHGIVHQFPLQPSMVRVPLDVPSQQVHSLGWRSLMLSQLRVGCNDELVRLLQEVKELQRHVGQSLILLVDEKIHYAVCRLLYSHSHGDRDVATWLRDVVPLYGVWHPYKQTLHVVYRVFHPLPVPLQWARW